ncbi:MAG: 30S ribosomal protein S18 [candidate division WOR-3 bacterium]|nr:30S ribosomal protein S18 [candidate division WOR-3 bacterium]
MMIRKKQCTFCVKKNQTISYNNPILKNFISEKGKIIPSRYTGVCALHQRKLKRAIKLARNIGILSFTEK